MKVERVVAELIPKKEWTIFSHRAIWHGRRVCHSRKPACGACPIARLCPSFGEGPTDRRRGRRSRSCVRSAPEARHRTLRSRRTRTDRRAARTGCGRWPSRRASLDGGDLSRFLPPDDGSGRQSAVLMAFADIGDGPAVLLIERAADMRKHAGQVAFPGGSLDPDRRVAGRRRPARGARGGRPRPGRACASSPTCRPSSSRCRGSSSRRCWRGGSTRTRCARSTAAEVARVALVPVAELADPANRFRVTHPSGWIAPGFRFEAGGLFVWGFTAGLLDRLLEFGGWARPWDRDVLRELPPPSGAGAERGHRPAAARTGRRYRRRMPAGRRPPCRSRGPPASWPSSRWHWARRPAPTATRPSRSTRTPARAPRRACPAGEADHGQGRQRPAASTPRGSPWIPGRVRVVLDNTEKPGQGAPHNLQVGGLPSAAVPLTTAGQQTQTSRSPRRPRAPTASCARSTWRRARPARSWSLSSRGPRT